MNDERSLPALLREAERRVNQHVWGDRRAIVSIPARPDEDVDLLLMEAADQIDSLRAMLRVKDKDYQTLRAAYGGRAAWRGYCECKWDSTRSRIVELHPACRLHTGLAPETSDGHGPKCECEWCYARRSMPKPGMKEIVSSVRRVTDRELADFKEAIKFRDSLRASEKAFVQLCAPHGKDWLTCPECAKAAVKANAPRELTLQDFGYAPGNYAIKCLDCGQESLWCDKRAARCETCAKQALAENRAGLAQNGEQA